VRADGGGPSSEPRTRADVGRKLLTASDLARLCEVDLKTIHNWVNRDKVAHFRTPGRHLRFRAIDVARFLQGYGFMVPTELAPLLDGSIVVVGGQELYAQVERVLDGSNMLAVHLEHAVDALVRAGATFADVYAIDVSAVRTQLDVASMLDAIHRASPRSKIVAVGGKRLDLPVYVVRVDASDAGSLSAALGRGEAEAAPDDVPAGHSRDDKPGRVQARDRGGK
jgi:hypothetical protein